MVRVDTFIFYEDCLEEVLNTILNQISDTSSGIRIFSAAHKYLFLCRENVCRGKGFSANQVFHNHAGLQGLSAMRRPPSAGELIMQCRQSTDLLHSSALRMAKTVELLILVFDIHFWRAGPLNSRKGPEV